MRTVDSEKLGKVVSVLAAHPEGVWLRQISRETGISVSTVHYYIGLIEPLLEETRLGNMIRVLRLKPDVVEQLKKGTSLADIIRRVSLLKDVVDF